jgi:hypothetical protein
MFHHVECSKCGTTYNGKTGKSNQQAIAIYVTISSVIGIAIVLVFRPQTNTTPNTSWLPVAAERLDRQV